jgi:hypothetical protein
MASNHEGDYASRLNDLSVEGSMRVILAMLVALIVIAVAGLGLASNVAAGPAATCQQACSNQL